MSFRAFVISVFSLIAIALVSCSGGVSVPAAGTTAAPIATASGGSTTSPTVAPTTTGGAATNAPTPVSTIAATPTPAQTIAPTSTPTAVASGSSPAPNATQTVCPAPSPLPTAYASAIPFPASGGDLTFPPYGDGTVVVDYPSSNADSGQMLEVTQSATTFTDQGGGGPIPTPPPGYTAITYSADFFTKAQSVLYNSGITTVTASSPCYIVPGYTYFVQTYANGGGVTHDELSPAGGYPTTATTLNGHYAVTWQINSSNSTPPDTQPINVGIESVFIIKATPMPTSAMRPANTARVR